MPRLGNQSMSALKRVIEVPQPWASAIVLGAIDVVPLARKPNVEPGRHPIAAVGRDVNAMRDPNVTRFLQRNGGDGLVHVTDMLLGYARVHHIAGPDDCDLPYAFARGRWCWVLDGSYRLVLAKPPAYDANTWQDDLVGREAVTPAEWRARIRRQAMEQHGVDHPEDMRD